jgi:hypothetical protein
MRRLSTPCERGVTTTSATGRMRRAASTVQAAVHAGAAGGWRP